MKNKIGLLVLLTVLLTSCSTAEESEQAAATASPSKSAPTTTVTASPQPPTATPAPTLRGGLELSDDFLAEAGSLCDKAVTDGPITRWTWAAASPSVMLLEKDYDEETGWQAVDTIGSPSNSDEIQSVVCIQQTRIDKGIYLPIGGHGYRLIWDVQILGLPEGEPMGSHTFFGSNPPDSVSSTGPHYGSSPRRDADPWFASVFSEPWASNMSTAVSMQFNSDNTVLLVNSGYSLLSFDPESAELLNEIPFKEDDSYSPWLSLSPDWNLYADPVCLQREDGNCVENTVQIRNGTDGSLVRTLSWNNDYPIIYNLVFSPDNRFLYVGYSGNIDRTTYYYIRRWNVASGAGIDIVEDEVGRDSRLIVSPDGTQLLVSEGRHFRVYDSTTREYAAGFEALSNRISQPVVYSPDGSIVAAANCTAGGYGPCESGEVSVFETDTYEQIHTFGGAMTEYHSLAFTMDGSLLAGGSCDGVQFYQWEDRPPERFCTSGIVEIWDTATGEMVSLLQGHTGEIRSMVFSADGTSLYTGSTDGTIRKWDTGSD